jgi:hypothetical protein
LFDFEQYKSARPRTGTPLHLISTQISPFATMNAAQCYFAVESDLLRDLENTVWPSMAHEIELMNQERDDEWNALALAIANPVAEEPSEKWRAMKEDVEVHVHQEIATIFQTRDDEWQALAEAIRHKTTAQMQCFLQPVPGKSGGRLAYAPPLMQVAQESHLIPRFGWWALVVCE